MKKKLFISPHNDDETLFGSFTIMRENPSVLVVFDSYLQVERGAQGCDMKTRRDETRNALLHLGCNSVFYLGLKDSDFAILNERAISTIAEEISRYSTFSQVWAPAFEPEGHHQHNLASRAADMIFGNKIQDQYLTYTRSGGKSVYGRQVQIRHGNWISAKLKAMACYESQMDLSIGCWPHFLRDQTEYYI